MPIRHTVKTPIAALVFAGIAILPSICKGQEAGTSRVEQNNEGHSSLSWRLSFMGF